MTLITEMAVPFLDSLAPDYREEQYELGAAALERSWVAMSPFGPVVLCEQHVRSLLRDHRLRTVTM